MPRISSLLLAVSACCAQDAREIVRKSVELDQSNRARSADYTWKVRDIERRYDSPGHVTSEKVSAWETLILYGQPFRRFTERDNKPLTEDEKRKEQQKIDREVAKLKNETPERKRIRLADEEKARQKNREFLREVPDAFNFHLDREDKVDGRGVWVISATPRKDYQPKRADAKSLSKMKGALWIDKAEFQWVKIEAETIDTISFGLFIFRLTPGSKMTFDQTRINDEVWLPRTQFITGEGRVFGKKIIMQQERTWSDFRKFRVESNIVQ